MALKKTARSLSDSIRSEIRQAKLGRPLTFGEWCAEVTPRFNWKFRHLVYLRDQLDRLTRGEINKLMIFMPPRHGKSEQITIRYPAWFLERFPERKVIIGAYNQTLSNKFSRKTRKISAQRMALSAERTAVEDWETEEGGGLRAVGVGGGITGQGGDIIIIDDPVKSREEANSPAYREKVWDWYTDDLYTRLEPGGALILIMTRWHVDDLAGRILKSEDGENWTVVCLPAFAEVNDPLGRKEGTALCPERFDEEKLKKIKLVMGASFEALYQQRPVAAEGAIFKREWWGYYKALPVMKRIIQSWDTAFKKGAANDYSVCTTWGEGDIGYYLLDRWKEKVEFPELKRTVRMQGDKWKPSVILVEDKASGQSLIQEIRRETPLPILAIKVDVDKETRAHAVTPVCEAGRVYLPEGIPWGQDYVDTMASFPYGDHDDDVDSTTQALNYLMRSGGGMGLIDYYAEILRAEKEQVH